MAEHRYSNLSLARDAGAEARGRNEPVGCGVSQAKEALGRVLQSIRNIKATDFSNGTIAAKLKEFCYLSAEGGVIEQQTLEIR
jgi:hypothetical protein